MKLFYFQDAIVHAVIAAGTFAGAAATASYVPRWREYENSMFGNFFGEITRSSEALAVSMKHLISSAALCTLFLTSSEFKVQEFCLPAIILQVALYCKQA